MIFSRVVGGGATILLYSLLNHDLCIPSFTCLNLSFFKPFLYLISSFSILPPLLIKSFLIFNFSLFKSFLDRTSFLYLILSLFKPFLSFLSLQLKPFLSLWIRKERKAVYPPPRFGLVCIHSDNIKSLCLSLYLIPVYPCLIFSFSFLGKF